MVSSRARVRRGMARRRGFSLLEITLVLVIIGALMAIATVSLLGQGERAKIRTTWATMNVVKNAIQQYQLDASGYPPTLAALQAGQRPYLDPSKSVKDGWGQDLLYAVPGQNGRPFELFSKGPNTQFENGGGDDISIWKEPSLQ